MANVLKQQKAEQIRALGRLGWSLRRIQKTTGVRRETISRYLRAAGIEVRAPRGRCLGATRDSKAASQVTPDPGGPPGAEDRPDSGLGGADALQTGTGKPGRSPAASACEPYRELIVQALGQGRNAKIIWQDLIDDHAFRAGYQSVKRFVKKLRGQGGREAHPTIVTGPGEEFQVDYGDGPMVRHPDTGKYRRTRLFVLTLGYSRKAIWLLSFKSSSRRWCELHEEAFRRLGGVARLAILDNLKEGVIDPDTYDPGLNPLYRDMLAHYGVVALPARPRHPDRKGKVERSVGYAENSPLKGLRFESLEEAQAYLDRWAERWADTRIHGTTKRRVAAMFEEERPSLKPLPVQPFRYYQHGTRVVHLDGCVEVEAAYYGAPTSWMGRQVWVQWDGVHVRLLDPKTGELLNEHRKQPRGWRHVHPGDRPKRTPTGTLKLLARSRNAGPSVGTLCEEIHRKGKEAGVRRILGVLSLVKKHGAEPIDQACQAALEIGFADYRFVKKWIERHPPAPLSLRQVDPLIRELTHYRDTINAITATETP